MKLIEYLKSNRGSAKEIATAIGAYAPDVHAWAAETRPIPHKYGAGIEKATNGIVTRQELFPNEWQEIWPELLGANTPTKEEQRCQSDRRADRRTDRRDKSIN